MIDPVRRPDATTAPVHNAIAVFCITTHEIEDRGYFTEEAIAYFPGIPFRNKLDFNRYVLMKGVPRERLFSWHTQIQS
ncbi:MAG TPA: hypothetical protein P5318_14775 [Candidatus Hydrogenedentes bacterium]|nr:hypothetical protein [Candidatus Hydrogenedentota bacterium]HPC16745.1 hypothetical protein [Candidatus Hydrogenedentota bacterium]HRT21380.1 hypothetical protein [Candidatus Hydrogenedentota bacterium]HRT65925.1 hypothetical protein [Candidatus Hydrogenedentota bacterium]